MNEGPRLLLVLAVVGTLLMVGFAGVGPALGGDASDGADSDDDTETNDDGTVTVDVDQDEVSVESDSVVRSHSVVSASGTDVSVELNSTQVVRSNGDQCRISISANESDATVRTCDEVRENGVVRTDEDGDVNVVVRSNSVDVDAVSVSNVTESDGDD